MFSKKSIMRSFPAAALILLMPAAGGHGSSISMEEIAKKGPGTVDAVTVSRAIYYNDNQKTYSKEDIEAAKKLNSKGYRLYRSKKDRQAIPFYLKALKRYPMGATYYNLGNSLMNVHQYRKAEVSYLVALTYRPRHHLYNYNLACAYSLMNRTQLSLLYLEKALAAGYNAFHYMYRDPDMKNTRRTSGFTRIMKSYSANRLTPRNVLNEGYCEVSQGMEIERFLFRSKGKLIIRTEGVGPYAQYTEKTSREGTWSIKNGRLFYKTSRTGQRPLYLKINKHICSY